MAQIAVLVFFLVPLAGGFIVDTIFGSPPQTVDNVDLNKYLGRWFQMYANDAVFKWFEKGALCVTADYTLDPSGKITVLNSERLQSGNGTLRTIHGFASKTEEPGKFMVTLETVGFSAPYWIIKLGAPTYEPDGKYEYAVVTDNVRATL